MAEKRQGLVQGLAEEKAGPKRAKDRVSLSLEDIENIVNNAVRRAMEERDKQAKTHRLRNADLRAQTTVKAQQTQEDVATLALTVGPVTHAPGFIPSPPEAIVSRDFAEHRELIGKLEAMGYVVTLTGVEFDAYFEPTDEKGVILPGQKEPAGAPSLLSVLRDLDPRNSRIWLENWFRGKILSGERQMDAYAAEEDRNQKLIELQKVEAGDISHLDNINIDMGSNKTPVETLPVK